MEAHYHTNQLQVSKRVKLRFSLIFSLIFVCSLTSGQNLKVIDSIRSILHVASEEKQFDLLNTLGFEYRFSFPDSTIYYCTKSYRIGQRLNLSLGLSRPLSFIGLAKANQGDYASALDFHNRSLTVAEEQEDTIQLAHGHNNIGRIFFDKGDYIRAYNEFVTARDLFESVGDTPGLAYVYRSLSDVFEAKGDYVKALDNAQKALRLRKNLGDRRAMTSAYMEMGLVYQEMDSTELALSQFQIADSIASAMNDKLTKAEINVGMAEILCKKGRSPEAGAMAEEVLRSVTEIRTKKFS